MTAHADDRKCDTCDGLRSQAETFLKCTIALTERNKKLEALAIGPSISIKSYDAMNVKHRRLKVDLHKLVEEMRNTCGPLYFDRTRNWADKIEQLLEVDHE